jgi:hypothetical protein
MCDRTGNLMPQVMMNRCEGRVTARIFSLMRAS